ncbi:MAG: hypothetical protein ACTSSA_11455 [Candidatus Freyarchaeota archaeon]
MDIAVVYPENYSALCAVTQTAPKFIEAAERMGYSGDLCSYARNTIGTTFEEGAPLGVRRGRPWAVSLPPTFLLSPESSARHTSSGGRF